MSNIGEFDLIERISAQFRDNQANGAGTLGIGDDCAVLPQREGLDTLVTTDLLIEERHFLLSDISPWQLGWKSAAVNISDIAAMGGRPEATFLSIALPMGISFYTLQAIGYLVDVHREVIPAEKNYFKFLLFISFFPLVIQGPICRFGEVTEGGDPGPHLPVRGSDGRQTFCGKPLFMEKRQLRTGEDPVGILQKTGHR